ncbi:hypothetical protein HYW75_06245 [Candidatus Pacearchaeota archaeon]|nr:hypothetical protein [Candidatus Pacearchaeota archaeon]
MIIKEQDIVMCKVKNIEGTTIFLKIEGNGEGSMVMSEVAAGRIRNLRAYVAPNKLIVCKVMKITPGNIQLSLRRVTAKERKQVEEQYKKEKTLFSMLKNLVQNPEEIITKIKEDYVITIFLDESRSDPKLLEKYFSKEQIKKLTVMLAEKEEKEKIIKNIFILKSSAPSAIKDIKEILSIPGLDIRYLGSSKFSISATAKDFKEAEHKISSALKELENRAKDKKAIFEIKE